MLIFTLIFLMTLLYIPVRRHYSKWQRLGISFDEPGIPCGSLSKFCLGKMPFGLVITDIYGRFEDKLVGIYLLSKPVILLRDAELVHQIMTTDFASFHDRGMYVDEKHDPMSANLLTMGGQSWRNLRAKLKPAFSSGQLKGMFGTIDNVADKFIKHMKVQLEDGKVHTIELKHLTTTYAIDTIGTVIFGLDIDSFTNPNNEFRILSDRIFNPSNILQKLYMLMFFVSPSIIKWLSRVGIKDPVTRGLREIVKRTIEFRESNNVVRKDLLQLMIQLRNTDKITDDYVKLVDMQTTADPSKSLSIDMIASNSFIFYMGGSESISAALSFTIYEFAMYPEIFERAQREVDKCLENHGLMPEAPLTYEALKDMIYLDLCIKETTRKYPPLPVLNRTCTEDYLVPGTDFTIKKGTNVAVPLFAIHRDPEYFPNPMDYKPERFTEEKLEYDPVAYMAFGVGPRHCIAQRMGVVNVKVALAKFLANFHIEPIPRREVEFQFHIMPMLVPKEDLRIQLTKRR